MEINIEQIKQYIDKNFIDEITLIYEKAPKTPNEKYFIKSGDWNNRMSDSEIVKYFNNILFYPNICVIDYILNNKGIFKDKIFLDYACGFGLLSIFLEKLNITCYNYDNFKQIDKECVDFFTLELNKFIKFNGVSNKLLETPVDVLICCGYFLNDNISKLNPEYIILEAMYENKHKTPNHYNLIDRNKELLIYKR